MQIFGTHQSHYRELQISFGGGESKAFQFRRFILPIVGLIGDPYKIPFKFKTQSSRLMIPIIRGDSRINRGFTVSFKSKTQSLRFMIPIIRMWIRNGQAHDDEEGG